MRLLLAVIGLCCLSCAPQSEESSKKYLFLGHTYQWGVKDNNRIDHRFKDFDFKAYDGLWLGGDICARTGEAPETLDYLDSIFDLSSDRTHWALGNHDLGHGPLEWIESRTRRKTYYSSTQDGFVLVVLNTNEFHHPNYQPKPKECALLDGQIKMLVQLADTIQEASHLVLLHHHTLLTNRMTNDSLRLNLLFNLYHEGLQVGCTGEHTFESFIYPLLQKIQEKGIQVILVSGDLGQRSKSFEYQTDDGIWFLGSGINNSAIGKYLPDYVTDTSPDKLLIFEYHPRQGTFTWSFELFEALRTKKASK